MPVFTIYGRFNPDHIVLQREGKSIKAVIEAAVRDGVDLSCSNMAGIDLSGADLCGAKVRNCDISRSNFSYSEIAGADFTGTNFHEANFTGVHMSVATVPWADVPLPFAKFWNWLRA